MQICNLESYVVLQDNDPKRLLKSFKLISELICISTAALVSTRIL